MLQLGLMYRNGTGVPQDIEKAVTWIRMAAQKGNAQAQQILKNNGLSW
jgi:TPR repeat protein